MIGIEITSVKQFMNRFLATEGFDLFLLEEATIAIYNTFTIDGHINQEFYASVDETEEGKPKYEFSQWSDMRQVVFQLIKGKRTPLQMKFVLHLKPELIQKLLEKADTTITMADVRSLVLTIRYDQNGLKLVTATAFQTFVMDKTLDKLWDDQCKKLLDHLQLPYEIIA